MIVEGICPVFTLCFKVTAVNDLSLLNNISLTIADSENLRAAYSTMTDETKEHFIDKMAAMPPAQAIEKDIEIVTELGKKGGVAFRPPEGHVVKAAQLLWSIAVLEKPYSISVTQMARKKFCEQVQSWDDSFKETYVRRCLENISNRKFPL